jgi:2',3'-cyclic-nucleotide 2'-phosphodiesterase (5'-nucleotidase family)
MARSICKYTFTGFLILLTFTSCVRHERILQVKGQLVLLDSINVPEKDYELDSIIGLFRSDLEKEMNQVLAYSAEVMRKASPEGLLNNFVADLVMDYGRRMYEPEDGRQIDFCLLNYGGLRSLIPEGAVTRSNIFELMPFENEMVVLTLSAENTMALFEYLVEQKVGHPVSGIRLRIDGQEINDIKIQGQEFVHGRTYKVLTTDYLAGGGDNMNFFLNPIDSELIGLRVRDAILMHLEEQHEAGKEIGSQLDGRIIVDGR